jgi:SAM-dependent methyltransferase
VTRCALLLRPSANRVYGTAAPGLGLGELAVLDELVLGGVLTGTQVTELGGVPYLVGDVDGPLDPAVVEVLSNLSGLHALFEVEGDVLRPVAVRPLRRHDDDVLTIQRYVGKTNEALTHLLVNLALAAGPGTFRRVLDGARVRLLDPACGRGTTLNRAIVYGLDAVGVEHDGRDVEAYEAFLLGWLRDKRLKHEVARERHRKGRATPAHRFTVTYGAGKDRATHHVVEVVADDTTALRDHLPARSVDALACDLPYGVQHGARSAPGPLRRSPAELLAAALPAWREVLRPGAGLALAWNLRTLPRADLVALLEDHDLELCVPPDDARFEHRVDRSITRDVVLARRPGAER